MEMIQFIPCTDSTSAVGTSLKGYIENVTTNQLFEMFGWPEKCTDGKVTMQWTIETQTVTEDGTTDYGVFTLYDWKGSRPCSNDEPWTVNVGGSKLQDLWDAQRAFEIFNTTDIRYSEDYACMAQGVYHEAEAA